ncbi:MAG: PIN domain-containing protein [Propionibacteriaceae bacterium]|nr:PIN domain-containing protein [Propionibacteriaceae bacterium]
MIVLDSCILIAFAEPTNVLHEDAKRILTTTESLAITALSGAEIMVHPPQDQRRRWRNLFRALAIEVVPIAADDMEDIANMRRISGLKMPDALVLWLAQRRQATVASFDRQLLNRATQLGLRTVH